MNTASCNTKVKLVQQKILNEPACQSHHPIKILDVRCIRIITTLVINQKKNYLPPSLQNDFDEESFCFWKENLQVLWCHLSECCLGLRQHLFPGWQSEMFLNNMLKLNRKMCKHPSTCRAGIVRPHSWHFQTASLVRSSGSSAITIPPQLQRTAEA